MYCLYCPWNYFITNIFIIHFSFYRILKMSIFFLRPATSLYPLIMHTLYDARNSLCLVLLILWLPWLGTKPPPWSLISTTFAPMSSPFFFLPWSPQNSSTTMIIFLILLSGLTLKLCLAFELVLWVHFSLSHFDPSYCSLYLLKVAFFFPSQPGCGFQSTSGGILILYFFFVFFTIALLLCVFFFVSPLQSCLSLNKNPKSSLLWTVSFHVCSSTSCSS